MTATCDTLLPSLETVLQLKMSFRHVPRPGEPLDHQQLLIDSVFSCSSMRNMQSDEYRILTKLFLKI